MTKNQEYAHKYAALGWFIFPAKGKFPCTPNGVLDASNDPATLDLWFECGFAGANMGLACGKSGIAVVDVDPRHNGHETLAALIQKHGPLPDTATQLSGGGGEHYLFKLPPGKKLKNLGPGIDSKQGNSYIIIEPSVHPETGQPYQWEGSSDPLEGAEMVTAPDWMLEDVEATGGNVVPLKGRALLAPEKVRDLRSALTLFNPDDYHEWIFVGQALHGSEAGDQAFGVWSEWSQGSDKYNANNQRRKWATFTAGRGLVPESIFKEAQARGWVNPAASIGQAITQERPRPSVSNDELKALIDSVQTEKQYQAIERPALELLPVPVPALRELADWMSSQLSVYYPHAIQAAVLSLAACLVSRQYVSIEGDPARLYFGIVAESVGSVRQLRALCHRFLSDVGQRGMIRATRVTSASVLYRTLNKNPCLHYVSDDYGQLIEFARRQPSGVYEQMLNTLADVYTQTDAYLDSDLDPSFSSLENPTIYHPSLNLLALISDDVFPRLCARRELGRGALEQMIIVRAGEPVVNDAPVMATTVPARLQEIVQALRRTSTRGNLSTVSGANLPPDLRVVSMEGGVAGLLADIDNQLRLDVLARENRRLMPLFAGARGYVRRLLVTQGAFDAPDMPISTIRHADWAGRFARQCLGLLLDEMDINGGEDGNNDTYQKVLEVIFKAATDGVTSRELIHNCRAYRSLSSEKRAELTGQMIKDQQIVTVDLTPVGGGRVKTVFIHHKFAKERGQ